MLIRNESRSYSGQTNRNSWPGMRNCGQFSSEISRARSACCLRSKAGRRGIPQPLPRLRTRRRTGASPDGGFLGRKRGDPAPNGPRKRVLTAQAHGPWGRQGGAGAGMGGGAGPSPRRRTGLGAAGPRGRGAGSHRAGGRVEVYDVSRRRR